MLEFVNKQLAVTKGRVTDPSFINIAQGVIKNHKRIRDRYLTSAHAVPSSHILIKILAGLNLNGSLQGAMLGYHIDDIVDSVAAALRLTSPVSHGEGSVTDFMDAGHCSVLLVSNRFDDTIPWYELEPVRYEYHTNTNTNFVLGQGDDSSYAFVSINARMLAHQYLAWRRWRKRKELDESIRNFIAKYPLFNAIRSYYDISIINRHYYRLTGTPIPRNASVSEWPITSYEDRMDKLELKRVGDLLSGGRTVGQALYSIPTVFSESGLDYYRRTPVVRTSAVRWWDYATLLPLYHFGLTVSNMSGYNPNQSTLGTLDREIASFVNTRTLDKVPKHLSQHIMGNFIEPTRELVRRLR